MSKSIVYTVTVKGNVQVWRLGDKLHREDGPALIDVDYQAWYLNGKRHREDGPAIIGGDYQSWYLNGERHREDGPAFIHGHYVEYWIEGKKYTKEEFDKKTKNVSCVNKEVIIDGVTYKLVPKEPS